MFTAHTHNHKHILAQTTQETIYPNALVLFICIDLQHVLISESDHMGKALEVYTGTNEPINTDNYMFVQQQQVFLYVLCALEIN